MLAGGGKVFGVANGLLTTPNTVQNSALNVQIPSDNRETEVLLAGSFFVSGIAWVLLQVLHNYND